MHHLWRATRIVVTFDRCQIDRSARERQQLVSTGYIRAIPHPSNRKRPDRDPCRAHHQTPFDQTVWRAPKECLL